MGRAVWVRHLNGESFEMKLVSDVITLSKLKRLIRLHPKSQLQGHDLSKVHFRFPFGTGKLLASTHRLHQLKDGDGSAMVVGASAHDPVEIVLPMKNRKESNAAAEILKVPIKRAATDPLKSHVHWMDAKPIFEHLIVSSHLPVKNIPEDIFKTTYNYLCMAHMSLGKGHQGAGTHFFITPFLTCVITGFNGEAEMVPEYEINCVSVEAKIRADFVLKHAAKSICVMEAKKDELDLALSRALFACEATLDVQNLNVTFGVATNYKKWIFIQYADERIEKEEVSMDFCDDGSPCQRAVAKVASKLFAMLDS